MWTLLVEQLFIEQKTERPIMGLTLLCPNTEPVSAQVPLWLIYSQVSPWLGHEAAVLQLHVDSVHTLQAAEWKKTVLGVLGEEYSTILWELYSVSVRES